MSPMIRISTPLALGSRLACLLWALGSGLSAQSIPPPATAANWTATFLVAQFFPLVNQALNDWLGGAGWVYFIFAGLAAGFALFVWRNVPETQGKRDADEVWGRIRRD